MVKPKKRGDDRILTAGEEAFAAAIAAGASQIAAFRVCNPKSRASDATARTNAYRMAKRPHVRLRIAQLVAETKQRVDAAIIEQVVVPAARIAIEIALTRDWVRQELVQNVKMAKQAVPVLTAKGEPTGEYRVDLAAANKALELLGKELGMFQAANTDKSSPLDALDDEQVRKLADIVDRELGRLESGGPEGVPPGSQGGSGKPH